MIVVLVETDAEGVTEISLETVAFARSLAAEGGGITIRALVAGTLPVAAEEIQKQLGAHGVAEVHHVGGDAFDSYAGAAWAAALQEFYAATGSVVVLAAGSPRGNEVLAHLAARTGVPMAANVVSFSGLSPFMVTRQVVGGAVLEDMQLSQRPAILTVAGHSWTAEPAQEPVAATWHERTPEIAAADLVARVVSKAPKEEDLSGSL